MNLVQRVQDILLKPKETWPVIAAEPGYAKSLFMGYVAVLASIPPLASFVSMALGGLGMYTRVPLLSSLVASVVAYAVSLGMVSMTTTKSILRNISAVLAVSGTDSIGFCL